MNNITLAILALISTSTAVYVDLPGQMKDVFTESIEAAQQVCTAGDLKSMSVMLDAGWVMDRRLPEEKDFKAWMAETFKENNVKELSEDHWGNAYVYAVSDDRRSYVIRSNGPDGEFDTEDDMAVSGP